MLAACAADATSSGLCSRRMNLHAFVRLGVGRGGVVGGGKGGGQYKMGRAGGREDGVSWREGQTWLLRHAKIVSLDFLVHFRLCKGVGGRVFCVV